MVNRSERDASMRGYATREIELAAKNIKISSLITDERLKQQNVKEQRFRLASALLTLGRFEEAKRASTDQTQLEKIERYQQAMTRDDHEKCECQPDTMPSTIAGEYVQLPIDYAADRIYSPKHGRFMNIIKCAKCDDLNITDKMSHALRLVQAARANGDKRSDREILPRE